MKFILLLLAALSSTQAYNILVVFHMPSHSHNTLGKGIVDVMLKAGHTVTWITPYPEKVGKNPPKTLKIIDISSVKQFIADVDMTKRKSVLDINFLKNMVYNVTSGLLESPEVKDVLINTQFDAVVTESFFCDVLAGIAAIQQAPWIILNSVQLMPDLEAQVDEVRSISTVPMIFYNSQVPMTFIDRAINLMIFIGMAVIKWIDRPATIARYQTIFGRMAAARGITLPDFDDAVHNVSILFVNAHESMSPSYSIPPNVINIAGYHIDENPPPLPKDIQELLDNSPQGVIYFSMGSVLRSATLKVRTREALLRIFAALPYTVLWKFEEPLKDLPPNVHVRPWFPQAKILAHPNIRLFITHGGALSALEALQAGVPLLAVPVFGDQPANAARAVREGYALQVDYNDDMAGDFEVALKELLGNKKYSERVKYMSKLFRSRPVSPNKLIQHYIELAIETKGDTRTFGQLSSRRLRTREALLRIFAALPYTVLWKEEPLKDLPPNVHVRPWWPQPSVLAHPNIRLFITHGGALSSLEALQAGVPLLAIPVFGDQLANAARAVREGYALQVDYDDDMAGDFEVALKELLGNKKYSERVKYLSKLFRSRPVSPIKLIQHYIELAIETKGAYHLRSPSLQYKWYERWMLDLLIVALTVLTALAVIVTLAIRKLIKKFRGTSNQTEKALKKKKN